MYSTQRIDNVSLIMYEQFVDDDWVVLQGITQSSFQYDVPKSNMNILGASTSKMIMDGPVNASLSFSKTLATEDVVLDHTGLSNVRFHVGTSYANDINSSGIYVQGAISSYSINASAGEVPQMSVDTILDFANVAATTGFFVITGANAEGTSREASVYIPATGIQLNVGGQNGNNAISSASFTANFNWIKEGRIYDAISGEKFFLELARPIEYSASVEITLDDYMIDQFTFYNPKTWELKLYSDTSLIYTFTMENAELVGESIGLSSDGGQTVSLTYRGVA